MSVTRNTLSKPHSKDVSLVCLGSYRDGKPCCEGSGIKINGYVLAHRSAVMLTPPHCSDEFKVFLEHEISLVNAPVISYPEKLHLIKEWSCEFSSKFLKKSLFSHNCDDEFYKHSATFVLMATRGVYRPKGDCGIEAILTSISQALDKYGLLLDVNHGDRVRSFSGDILYFERGSGLVCYAFENTDIFLVDLKVPSSSAILSYPNCKKKDVILGISMFNKRYPHLYQMFPMCLSLKHLLSTTCFRSKCLPDDYLGVRDTRINRDPVVDLSVRVRCGNNLGSGTLISKDKILTCAHVVSHHMDADITVFFGNQTRPAKVIFCPDAIDGPDFAVLLVTPPPAPIIPMCFTPPKLGDYIFAVGTPYISETLFTRPFITSGEVVHLSKEFILGSCPVHDGFSGGGVFNTRGYLIGIVSGKAYPLSDSDPTPRITQIIPINFIRDTIRAYIASTSSEGILKQQMSELLTGAMENS